MLRRGPTEDSCSCTVQRVLVRLVFHAVQYLVGSPFHLQILVAAALVLHVPQ
jgi:hypothetical protein